MLKRILIPLILASALLIPVKPAAAHRGYRGGGVYVRPGYYGRPRVYVAPRVVVRPMNYPRPIYRAPYSGYYQPYGAYQYNSYGW